MLNGKEIRKNEKRKEERKKKKNKIEIFVFIFLNCEEKSWDSGAIFYIRIAKGFHLQEILHLFTVFILELLPYLKYRTPF